MRRKPTDFLSLLWPLKVHFSSVCLISMGNGKMDGKKTIFFFENNLFYSKLKTNSTFEKNLELG